MVISLKAAIWVEPKRKKVYFTILNYQPSLIFLTQLQTGTLDSFETFTSLQDFKSGLR